ncbi:ABC transporter permease [Draconibacterium sp.]|nr:ABC transporter permease [Draconibacterium sp.]
MGILSKIIWWDLKLLAKYKILHVALFIAVSYTGIFLLFNLRGNEKVLTALIFSDPTFMGFIFLGAMVLFEKSANTLQALVVTPIEIWQYLFSKAIALTMMALIICFAMVFAGYGFHFHYGWFFLATFLSSVLFILLGFIGVARVKSFNQYIIVIPVFLAPAILPCLNFFGVTNTFWFYIIPTQASLLMFEAAFHSISTFDAIYSIVYLLVSIFVTYSIAKKSFVKNMIRGN